MRLDALRIDPKQYKGGIDMRNTKQVAYMLLEVIDKAVKTITPSDPRWDALPETLRAVLIEMDGKVMIAKEELD